MTSNILKGEWMRGTRQSNEFLFSPFLCEKNRYTGCNTYGKKIYWFKTAKVTFPQDKKAIGGKARDA